MRSALRSIVLWLFGGALYFLCEVAYKTIRGEPEKISWTMFVLAAMISIILDQCNERLPWDMPLWMQAANCGLVITVVELIAGLLLNVWLGLGVWDYSGLPGNLWGQICPQFTALWILAAGIGIVLFDWLRYLLYNEEKPHYYFRRAT